MLPRTILVTAVALLLVGVMVSAAQAVVIIDDFERSQGPITLTMAGTVTDTVTTPPPTILGGSRTTMLTVSGTMMIGFNLASVNIGSGSAGYETQSFNFAHSLSLKYDGNGSGLGALLNGMTTLQVSFSVLQIFPAATNMLEVRAIVTPVMGPVLWMSDMLSNGETTAEFDFSGEDFNNLASVEFQFTTDVDQFAGTDFILTGIKAQGAPPPPPPEVIPEPATLSIWCVALSCLASAYCRRRWLGRSVACTR